MATFLGVGERRSSTKNSRSAIAEAIALDSAASPDTENSTNHPLRPSSPLFESKQVGGGVLPTLKSAPAGPNYSLPVVSLREIEQFDGKAKNALSDPRYATLKRLEDLILGFLILLLLSPFLILIAIGVKLTSSGPVLFKQPRGGVNGKTILTWKFRTMRFDETRELPLQASSGDPRITPLGIFLRRFSLDELPQFFQVLQGTMSIVGPRPHPLWLDEYYEPRVRGYCSRYQVKPGITGLAQVNGLRGPTDQDTKMKNRLLCDLHYIRNWSFWLDIRIILKTPLACIRGKNAC
jgi:lipopolysaccharide/colanic/teichoic acid biosynthesis glycosyltransferase